jgi:hypothetical protein
VPNNAATGHGLVTYTISGYYAVNTGNGADDANARRITVIAASATTPAIRRPTAIQPWNVEYSPGVEGSNLWDDFTLVHIWKSNDANDGTNNGYFRSSPGTSATDYDNWAIVNPAMSIAPADGVLYASHNENGSLGNAGSLRTSANNATTAGSTTVMTFVDPIIHSDIYRSPGQGNLVAATWAVSSIIGQGGNYMTWHNLGGVYIAGPGGGTVNLAYGGSAGNNITNPLYLGESTWYDASSSSTGQDTNNGSTKRTTPRYTDQFFNPHIVTSYSGTGNNTVEHIHVSYYDSKDGSIKYRYNERGRPYLTTANGAIPNNQNRDASNNIPKVWTNLDGGFDNEDMIALANNGPFPLVAANYRVVNYNTTNRADTSLPNRPITSEAEGYNGTYTRYVGIKAGEHNAIAVTSEGYPVVAYYDETNQKLKLAISGAHVPIDARNWIIVEDVIPADNANRKGTGQYVSIAIDGGRAVPSGGASNVQQNRIHIAAMNTNGNLVYIWGRITVPTSRTGTNGVYTANGGGFALGGVQVVDSVGTVGRWCKISLDEFGNPWIAYQDDGYIGSRDGAKVAYLNTNRFIKGSTALSPGEDLDLNGTRIEGWETMHVPTQFRVDNPSVSTRENGRLGLECFPTRNVATNNTQTWGAAVGYFTTYPQTRYRVAYYVK